MLLYVDTSLEKPSGLIIWFPFTLHTGNYKAGFSASVTNHTGIPWQSNNNKIRKCVTRGVWPRTESHLSLSTYG